MTINISVPMNNTGLEPRICVIGVGGAGGNAVNNMIRSDLKGVEFIVANTDNQALSQSLAERQVQLGSELTQGLGAGACPDVGRAAAEEALEDIVTEFTDTNMVFITAGMGGGTGTGAAPVIAQAARERDILTVGVVTKPFTFEGNHRMRLAEQGIEELTQYVDTLIIIPNQNLFRVANEKTTFADAFNIADSVLQQGVRGVTDLMIMPGLINLDFADIRTVMSEMGKAMMGTGESSGENRAIEAAEAAINNPLLDDTSMKGAQGVLISISGSMDMGLYEVDEAANRIRAEVKTDANIIFGSTFDDRLEGRIRVSVVATGIADEGVVIRPRSSIVLVSEQHVPAQDSGVAAEAEAPLPDSGTPDQPAVADMASAAPAGSPVRRPAAEPMVSGKPEVAADEAARQRPAAASGTENTFMPPPPVHPGARPVSGSRERAATATSSVEVPKPRSRSLFGLMTGIGRREREMAATPVEPALSGRSDPVQPPREPAAPAAADPGPGSVENGKPVRLGNVDDELVEIPSFLRRTAN